MKYALLIYENEASAPAQGTPEAERIFQEYYSFTNDVVEEGVYAGGDALAPTDTATTVRIRDGETTITDGPFAETKEQLGGFYLIDVADLDAAIQVAERIPGAKTGSIEIRPVWVFE